MSDLAIRVENLSKRYRIGTQRARYKTIRESLTEGLLTPFRRLRRNSQFEIRNSQSDHIWALNDVSFEVKRGEVVGIIGRNGAGKSTLLKILSRITEPTEGRAEIRGRVGSLLEVGTGFHPELTGRENIYLNGAILGMRKAEIDRKFDEIVAFAEVEKFIDTPVKHYSSGMYVRLAFAVAAHLEPEILLVDEVLAVGDAAFQKKCLGKMGDVAREGRTVLFVSHNMAAVNNLCGSAIWLEKGCFSGFGRTDEIVRDYLAAVGKQQADTLHVAPTSARVALKRIWTVTCEGNVSSALDVTQSFQINIEFDVRKRVSDVDIGIWISNTRGIPVCCTNLSELNGGELLSLAPGRYLGSFIVPALFFVPDAYRLMAKAHVPNVATEDYIPDAGEFSVVETGSALSRYSQSWRYGVVLGNFSWTLSNEG